MLAKALGLFVVAAIAGGMAAVRVRPTAPTRASARTSADQPPRRSEKELLAEFAANPSPGFDWSLPPAEHERLMKERLGRQCELALELWREHRQSRALTRLLFARWMNLLHYFHDPAQVRGETNELLAQRPPESHATLARFVRAQAALLDEELPRATVAVEIEEALAAKREPKLWSDASTVLLTDLATRRTGDPAEQSALLGRAIALAHAEESAAAPRRELALLDRIGERVEFDAADAFDGAPVRAAALRGRPVVVRTWYRYAAWSDDEPDPIAPLRATLSASGAALVTVATLYAAAARDEEIAAARTQGVASPFVLVLEAPDGSFMRRFGLDGPARWLLLDRDGVLRGIATRATALREPLAALAR